MPKADIAPGPVEKMVPPRIGGDRIKFSVLAEKATFHKAPTTRAMDALRLSNPISVRQR